MLQRQVNSVLAGTSRTVPCLFIFLLWQVNAFRVFVWVKVLASLVAQMVENLPEMRETQVPPLGRNSPYKKGMTTHSSILAWKIP